MEDEPDGAERIRPPLMGELVDSIRLADPVVEDQTKLPGEGSNRPIVPSQAA